MKRIFLILIVVVLALVGLYFLKPARTVATPSVLPSWSRADLWQGTWASEKTRKCGDFQVALEQDGSNITGDIKIGGSSITKGGKISGVIDGNKLEFGLIKDKKGRLKYVGTISENTMSGTWQIPSVKDRGTWQAAKKP